MYLHHPLWLLPLVVGSGGSRKHSRKHKDYESYETQRHKYSQERHTEDTFEEYDYYDDDYLETQVQGDRGPMIHDTQQIPNRNKLLIIVLGGFRSDYLKMYRQRTSSDLEGFNNFMSQGVRTEYLESVFPAESFPAWQTIQTGLYPESHGIVGNQFYDQEVHTITKSTCQAFFNIDDERSTAHMKWWQQDEVEPIWATAAKQGVRFATFLWGRCDIPYEGIKRFSPAYCENFYSEDLTKTLRINVDKALSQLGDGVDAAIIYDSMLKNAAEEFGPFSKEMDEKLRQLDSSLIHLEGRLNDTRMGRYVNVVILSDHGMSYGHHPTQEDININKIRLTEHLEHGTYRWIVGSGAHAGIYPRDPRYRREIISRLRSVPGLEVWERHEVPAELHYKASKNSPPILVLARPRNIILSSPPEVQRPAQGQCREGGRGHGRRQSQYRGVLRLMEQTRMGLAGYDPAEEDMRGIFMAKGPDFKREPGHVFPSIQLVDVYQVFTKLLGIPAQPNNGSWDAVRDLLVDPSTAPGPPHGHLVIIMVSSVMTRTLLRL